MRAHLIEPTKVDAHPYLKLLKWMLALIDFIEPRVKGISCKDRVGPAITYNSGTMLSRAADPYRTTNDAIYYKPPWVNSHYLCC